MAGKKRIYVLDDEQLIARTLCLILESSGYATTMFATAEAALARIEESAPDLVVSEVILAGCLTGIDMSEYIAHTHPTIKVILLSGEAQTAELIERAKARGHEAHVFGKPVRPAFLLAEIARLLLA